MIVFLFRFTYSLCKACLAFFDWFRLFKAIVLRNSLLARIFGCQKIDRIPTAYLEFLQRIRSPVFKVCVAFHLRQCFMLRCILIILRKQFRYLLHYKKQKFCFDFYASYRLEPQPNHTSVMTGCPGRHKHLDTPRWQRMALKTANSLSSLNRVGK